MSSVSRVRDVECLGGHVVRLTFSDGLVRELDLEPMLDGGVLEPIKDPGVFAGVTVDDVTGTVVWPNGVDLDPDVLHGDHTPASGRGPRLLVERHLPTPA